MIVADTGAVVALVDADDRSHRALRAHFESDPDAWVLPWAILPDYAVEWGDETDLIRAHALCTRHRGLRLGLVDGVVISVAERLQAEAIAPLDLRHFGVVQIRGRPRLLPRDLER